MGAAPSPVLACAGCGTGLAPVMVACPACHRLVYRERLGRLATEAGDQTTCGALAEARATWESALPLLPAGSQQAADIRARIEALDARIAQQVSVKPEKMVDPSQPAWRRWLAPVGTALLLILGKLKFLLLGLSKATTLFSMLAFFGVYWTTFGWPLALGMVVAIYIHEMGHVAALQRAGVAASAPFFIPGLGALVRLRQRVTDVNINATVGLAGPLWGLGATLASYLVFLYTAQPVWAAIAHLSAYLNLFNLLPVWQLDGARGMDALNRWQRGAVTAVIAATYLATHERLLVIVGAVALWQTVRAPDREGNVRIMLLFAALVAALGALSMVRG